MIGPSGPLTISAPRLLVRGRLTGPGAVTLEDGRIASVRRGVPPAGPQHVRMDRGVLTPGLLDLQNNGSFGVDFAEASPQEWEQTRRQLARRGVTGVQPTLITAPLPYLNAAFDRCAAAADAAAGLPLSRILGVHLEGPFLSEARRGAHRADWLCDPTPHAIDTLLSHPATQRMLRTLTLAPERDGAMEAIRQLAAGGVIVSVGHTDATAEQVGAAADAGASMVTHLFNAMRPFRHRDPATPGEVLTDPRYFVGLIVDGYHVSPITCRLVYAAAPGRVVAVTDAIVTAGLPNGTSLSFGGGPVANDETGLGRRPDGTIAGAGIVLDEGVRRLVAAGIDPAEVLASATEVPARSLGCSDVGHLQPGAYADLVWWDDFFRPLRVWIGGQPVPTAPGPAERAVNC